MTKLIPILFLLWIFGSSVFGAGPAATSQTVTVLDADAAARLAASLANAAARRQFDAAPFRATQAVPTFSDGRWRWQATAGYGKGDLQAEVSFTRSGTKQTVGVKMLILER